jgi:AbrB family looped-hinge helix DNA binding protein
MKDLDTLSVSRVGQATLPKAWRESSGLAKGGMVEVRPLKDGKNSIILTPRPARREGASGLLEAMRACPHPLPAPERHLLPAR